MSLEVLWGGPTIPDADAAVEALYPRMARRLAEYHRDLVLIETPIGTKQEDDVPIDKRCAPRFGNEDVHLADTLRVVEESGEDGSKLVSDKEYAWFILESGWRPHTIRPRNCRVLRFKVGGTTVYASEVTVPGKEPPRIISRSAAATVEAMPEIVEAELEVFADRLGPAPGPLQQGGPPA